MFVVRAGPPAPAVFAFVLAFLLSWASFSAAKPKESKDEAASRTEQKALRAYVAGDLPNAVRLLESAISACEKGCTSKTRAHLHISLGTVRGVGEGDYKQSKREFTIALSLDPEAKLRTLTTPELTAAFEEAKKALASTGPSGPANPPEKAVPDKPAAPDKPPPDKPVTVTDLFHNDEPPSPPPKKETPATKTEPEKPKEPTGPEPRWNWLSLRVDFDLGFLSDANICSPDADKRYYCTDEKGAHYTGTPQKNDDVSPGFAFSSLRLMLGYERVLFPNFTAGILLGFGLNFAPPTEGRSGASPLSGELRASYTFGSAPFVDGSPDRLTPYLFGSVGAMSLDSHVIIRVNEIPCASKVAPACKRDLDAYRLASGIFATFGGGARFRIEGRHALRAGLRTTLIFDGPTFVFSPEIAYELGI